MSMRRRRMLMNQPLTSKGVVDTFIQDDWSQIAKICAAGRAQEFYSIGDRKILQIGSEYNHEVILCGFDFYDRADGKGKANTVWCTRYCLKTMKPFNENKYSDWGKSTLRAYLSTTIWDMVPAYLQKAILPVILTQAVTEQKYNFGWFIQTTEDKLFLASKREMYWSTEHPTPRLKDFIDVHTYDNLETNIRYLFRSLESYFDDTDEQRLTYKSDDAWKYIGDRGMSNAASCACTAYRGIPLYFCL